MSSSLVAFLALVAYANACGTLQKNRIVGGTEADAHAWPWQISLHKRSWISSSHICGGTLIDANWVVTAAHCVDGGSASEFSVVAGEHHQTQNGGTEQTRGVSRIIMHQNYDGNGNGFPNDIALLKLSQPVSFNGKIQPACLPSSANEEFTERDECWITGWGNTASSTESNSVLRELEIDIVTNSACSRMWGSGYINDRHVCVGNGRTGACNGDSGGPLVCKRNNAWTLVGATSWGRSGCTTEGYPNVYTRVSKFLSWINNNMSSN